MPDRTPLLSHSLVAPFDPPTGSLEVEVYRALTAGDLPTAVDGLERARFISYRAAATTWDDPPAIHRVARVEELQAELCRQQDDLEGAWVSWRTAWWIRRARGVPTERNARRAMAWSDAVLGCLDWSCGRQDAARERIEAALDPWHALELDAALGAELEAWLTG